MLKKKPHKLPSPISKTSSRGQCVPLLRSGLGDPAPSQEAETSFVPFVMPTPIRPYTSREPVGRPSVQGPHTGPRSQALRPISLPIWPQAGDTFPGAGGEAEGGDRALTEFWNESGRAAGKAGSGPFREGWAPDRVQIFPVRTTGDREAMPERSSGTFRPQT